MKKIEPLSIWYDGNFVNATLFDLNVSGVSLGVSATINFRLYSHTELQENYPCLQLSSGTLILDGQDYLNWGTDDNYIWEWTSNKLNITIISDTDKVAPLN